jgi:hypothetical protein
MDAGAIDNDAARLGVPVGAQDGVLGSHRRAHRQLCAVQSRRISTDRIMAEDPSSLTGVNVPKRPQIDERPGRSRFELGVEGDGDEIEVDPFERPVQGVDRRRPGPVIPAWPEEE